MDLSTAAVRRHLVLVEAHGWDCTAARDLLQEVRRSIVEPVVRRCGLTGAAADQAVASGWAAAWEALRRPSSRTAGNPAGMAWVAAQRAVWAEVAAGRGGPDPQPPIHLVATVPEQAGDAPVPEPLGPSLEHVVGALVDEGWERAVLVAAIQELADHAVPASPGGAPSTRWRWVALRVGIPEWQARRLASALLGVPGHPGVLALVASGGPDVLAQEGIRRVLRSTRRQGLATPAAHLDAWAAGPRPMAAAGPPPGSDAAPAAEPRPDRPGRTGRTGNGRGPLREARILHIWNIPDRRLPFAVGAGDSGAARTAEASQRALPLVDHRSAHVR